MKSSRAKALALSAALACSMALPPAFAAAEDAMRPGPSSARSAEEDAPSSWADAGDDASSSGETPVQDSLAADGSVGESGGAGAADGSDPADPANAAGRLRPLPTPAASADAAKARAAVPSWGFDGISVAGMSGQQALSRVTTDEDGTSRFWTNSASVKLLAAPSAPLKLLARAAGDPVPKAADFSAASGALTLKAQDLPRDVYALAEADCTFNAGTPDEKSLKQGDIVCLPRVCADATPARLDGNAAAEGGRLFFGTLYASSLALTVPAADPAPSPDPGDPADASDPADAASGPVKAQLLHDGSLIAEADAAPADRGAPSVSFRLKLPVGSYDLQKLSVRLTDVAGNRADRTAGGPGAGGRRIMVGGRPVAHPGGRRRAFCPGVPTSPPWPPPPASSLPGRPRSGSTMRATPSSRHGTRRFPTTRSASSRRWPRFETTERARRFPSRSTISWPRTCPARRTSCSLRAAPTGWRAPAWRPASKASCPACPPCGTPQRTSSRSRWTLTSLRRGRWSLRRAGGA